MLLELHIKDFAIIHNLDIEFGKGLNVITGETGAGKSIIIDALQALMGGKGVQEYIRDGAKEAVIEGKFSISPDFPLREKFRELDYINEDDQEIILRRVISQSGKSKSFLNGNMVNLSLLSELSECLLEIHGQNHQTSLFKKPVQLFLFDTYASLNSLKDEYEALYNQWNRIVQTLHALLNQENDKNAKQSFLLFQTQEMESARLDPDEEDRLNHDREILSKSEYLKSRSAEAHDILSEEESAVLTHLQKISRLLSDLQTIDPQVDPVLQLLKSAQIQLKEADRLLRDYREKVEFQPEKLEKIEKRLFDLSQLKKKYGKSIPEIIDYHKQIKEELSELENLESGIHNLRSEQSEIEKNLEKLSEELSVKRKEASKEFEIKVLKELKELKIEQAQFKVMFYPVEGELKFSRFGKETISFLTSMNPGYAPAEIDKVASGGELSRLMLALKTVLSKSGSVPVLIFDEIDSGVGGAVAEYIGKRLWSLAGSHQIFCITHLPQIASYGQYHIFVEKKIKGAKTEVAVKLLNKEERVLEIGRMLGGITITPKAIKHAEEMISRVPSMIR